MRLESKSSTKPKDIFTSRPRYAVKAEGSSITKRLLRLSQNTEGGEKLYSSFFFFSFHIHMTPSASRGERGWG